MKPTVRTLLTAILPSFYSTTFLSWQNKGNSIEHHILTISYISGTLFFRKFTHTYEERVPSAQERLISQSSSEFSSFNTYNIRVLIVAVDHDRLNLINVYTRQDQLMPPSIWTQCYWYQRKNSRVTRFATNYIYHVGSLLPKH